MMIQRLWFPVFLVVVACLFVSVGGCHQRKVAPAVTYDQSKVDLLDSEVKKLDWEF